MDERDFARFEFKMSFGRISYVAQNPWAALDGRCENLLLGSSLPKPLQQMKYHRNIVLKWYWSRYVWKGRWYDYILKKMTLHILPYIVIIVQLNTRGFINSSPPNDVYMCQWTVSSLVRVMACRLFGAKPFPEPMLTCCQLDAWEQISMNFEAEFYHLHSRKCIWKCRLPKWRPFCPGEIS